MVAVCTMSGYTPCLLYTSGAGVLARRGAEPRCFRATGVGVDKCSTAVPVDADAAEPVSYTHLDVYKRQPTST